MPTQSTPITSQTKNPNSSHCELASQKSIPPLWKEIVLTVRSHITPIANFGLWSLTYSFYSEEKLFRISTTDFTGTCMIMLFISLGCRCLVDGWSIFLRLCTGTTLRQALMITIREGLSSTSRYVPKLTILNLIHALKTICERCGSINDDCSCCGIHDVYYYNHGMTESMIIDI